MEEELIYFLFYFCKNKNGIFIAEIVTIIFFIYSMHHINRKERKHSGYSNQLTQHFADLFYIYFSGVHI